MELNVSSSDGTPADLGPLLHRTGERIKGRWRGDDASPEQVADQVEELIEAVTDGNDGLRRYRSRSSASHRRLRSEILEIFREEILEESANASLPEASLALSLVPTLEELRTAVQVVDPEVDQPPPMDAFNVLVELIHDMRAPLTSILFLSEVLASHTRSLSAQQLSQIRLIYSGAFRLSAMASDVMEFATRGGDYFSEEPNHFSLLDVVGSVEEMVLPMALEKSIELRIVTPEGQDEFVGYPIALQRALLNLTVNAVKFTSAGHVEVAAQLVDENEVLFSVTDTGPGISRQNRRTVFHPFHRSKRTAGYVLSPAGLGLSIARKLVAGMDGRLEYTTERDVGTRFTFTIRFLPVTD